MESKIKILYIDDEELNLSAFERLFRREYDITIARSSKEGEEILKEKSFQIILVDQRMPGTTGAEFLKEIANIYPDTMRVLVTAYSDLSAVVSALNEGKIYKYISKPYKKEEMISVIEEAYQVLHLRQVQKNDFSKYKELFENSRDSIFLVNKFGKIIDANDSCLNLLAFSRDEMVAKELSINVFEKISVKFDFTPPLDELEELENKEITFQSEDGGFHDCLVSLLKIYDEYENLIGYQGTIKNITNYKVSKRNSMRGMLEQKEREKEFVVNILHENSAQNLTWVHFLLSHLEKKSDSLDAKETLAGVNSTLIETIKELRDVCFEILPKSLENGIGSALEDLAKKMKLAFNTNCSTQIEDDLTEVSKDFRIMVFRTIQNILRGMEKENSNLVFEISSDSKYIYSLVSGKKLLDNETVIDQVKAEIDLLYSHYF